MSIPVPHPFPPAQEPDPPDSARAQVAIESTDKLSKNDRDDMRFIVSPKAVTSILYANQEIVRMFSLNLACRLHRL